MATIQQSIDIKAPVHALYQRLTQFEEYPRFMEDVEQVQKLDDNHLHWTTRMANRPVEWDAEITEQESERCIAWHNTSGPTNAGKIEVQEVGPDTSRLIFTLRSEPQQVPGSMAGNTEQEMAQRLRQDLARLKNLIESDGSQAGTQGQSGAQYGQESGPVADVGLAQGTGRSGDKTAGIGVDQVAELGADQGTDDATPRGTAEQQDAIESAQGDRGSPRNAPLPTSAYAAGSEGWSGEEDPAAPVVSANQAASGQRTGAAGQSQQQTASAGSTGQARTKTSIQPAPVRHVGQMPQDTTAEQTGGTPSSDAKGKPTRDDQ